MAMTITAQATTVTLTTDQLSDRIRGAWAGKTIGCTYGGPVEFTHCGTMVQPYTPVPWDSTRVKHYFDTFPGLYDDVYVDIVLAQVLQRDGLEAPADSFASAFARAGFPLWHANQQAKHNITHGLEPRLCGHWLNNPHADDIDFQIEADFAGIVSPGLPQAAASICDRAGHLFNYGDGFYGGVYVAGLYSAAFICSDPAQVVNQALALIPSQSDFHKCITEVINGYQRWPDDWQRTWLELQRNWSQEVGCPDGVFLPFDIDAKLNSAYLTMGLLYGNGDFTRTIDIATRCGQDADCNPSTAAGILGAMIGFDAIPHEWRAALDPVLDIPFAYTDISLNGLDTLCLDLAKANILQNGGSVKGDQLTIAVQTPKAVPFEKSFEGHIPYLRTPVDANLAPSGEPLCLTFNGVGAVLRGYVKSSTPGYEARLQVTVDGVPQPELLRPAGADNSIDNRSPELWWLYQLPQGPHTVCLRWLNPAEGAYVHATDLLLYKAANH